MMIVMLSSRIPRGEGRERDGDKQVGEGEQGDATKGSNLGCRIGHSSPLFYRGLGLRLQGRLG